jgi:uncharacterized membrane-anchored protein YhcB (DUF1043 family)
MFYAVIGFVIGVVVGIALVAFMQAAKSDSEEF